MIFYSKLQIIHYEAYITIENEPVIRNIAKCTTIKLGDETTLVNTIAKVCTNMIQECSKCYAILSNTKYAASKPHFESVGSGLVLVDSGTNSSLHFRITAKLGLLSRTKEYDYDETVHIVNDVIDPNKNLPFNTYKNLAAALSIILSKVKNEIHY